jgi:hypothetical protein
MGDFLFTLSLPSTFFFYPFSFSHHSSISFLLPCPDGCFMCSLANFLVLLTHYTADSSTGRFPGLSWPNPITFHHCTTSQHDHYSTPILLWVTNGASLLPLAQFTLYIQSAIWLTPITCLVSQSLVTFSLHHSDLPLYCHSSWTSWPLKMGRIHCPKTLVTNQPMLHKIPEGWRSQVILFYMQSSFIIFHYTMASYDQP